MEGQLALYAFHQPLQCPGGMLPYTAQRTSISIDSKSIAYGDFASEQSDSDFLAPHQHHSTSSTPACPSLEPDIYSFDEVRRAFLGYPNISSAYEQHRHYDFFPLQSPFGSDDSPNYASSDLVESISPHSTTLQPSSPFSNDFVTPYHDQYSRTSTAETRFTHPEDENDNESDSLSHEPYAKLIYRALMEAPGHRMVLRDIYEWFQRHTHKPRESGSNGWQNSIRHNLSMNQAFENDKTDFPKDTGQAKKSNSVWLLTATAIEHGVQSTTRYRKTGHAKKAGRNTKPAVQRQRSGAKGGQAARRTAQLRRRQQSELRLQSTPSTSLSFLGGYQYVNDGPHCTGMESCAPLAPLTPPEDPMFAAHMGMPVSTYHSDYSMNWNYRCDDDHRVENGEPRYISMPEPGSEDMFRLRQAS